jgi:hypothetical protein
MFPLFTTANIVNIQLLTATAAGIVGQRTQETPTVTETAHTVFSLGEAIMNREERRKSHIALCKQMGLEPRTFIEYLDHVVDTIQLMQEEKDRLFYRMYELIEELHDEKH